MQGPFSVELLVNAQGHVCDAQVLTARDRTAASMAAQYMLRNWTFEPAMRQGKPVAVKFTVNFVPR